MNQQQISALENFEGKSLTVIYSGNEAWLTATDIGLALEYAAPRDSILNIFERNRAELEEFSTTINLMAVDSKKRETRVFSEEGVLLLCMFSKQPKAAAFRRWAVGVLKAYRQGKLVTSDPSKLHSQLISACREYRKQNHLPLRQILSARILALCAALSIPVPAGFGERLNAGEMA